MSEFEKVELAGGRVTLYRGDCLALLAAGLLKCDAIVADPPYGIGYQHSGGTKGNVPSSTKKILGDDVPFDPAPWISAAPKSRRQRSTELVGNVGKCGLQIVLFGADKFHNRLPECGVFLAWDKHLGQAGDDSFTDCEWAWCGKKVRREVFRWLWKGVVAQKHPDDMSPTKGGKGHGGARFARVHVSQKPVALMRWCIEKLKVRPGGVILDPYMGSASTGIAALSLGYCFVGVEKDPEDFKVARQRIEAWWAEHGGKK